MYIMCVISEVHTALAANSWCSHSQVLPCACTFSIARFSAPCSPQSPLSRDQSDEAFYPVMSINNRYQSRVPIGLGRMWGGGWVGEQRDMGDGRTAKYRHRKLESYISRRPYAFATTIRVRS